MTKLPETRVACTFVDLKRVLAGETTMNPNSDVHKVSPHNTGNNSFRWPPVGHEWPRCRSWPTGESVFFVGEEHGEYLAYFSVTVSLYRQFTVNTMNNMSPEVALHRISPELRPLLCSVVRNGRVGLDSTNCLRVTDLKTGWASVLGPLALCVKQCGSSLLRSAQTQIEGDERIEPMSWFHIAGLSIYILLWHVYRHHGESVWPIRHCWPETLFIWVGFVGLQVLLVQIKRIACSCCYVFNGQLIYCII